MKHVVALPQVTVLMPVYNGVAHLREAVDSILAQSFADFEFLIINDGSTDGSSELLRAYSDPRIRLLDNPVNLGLVATRNRGLELARGALVARQDHDDWSRVDRLQMQVDFLRSRPEVLLVGSEAFAVDARGRIAYRLLRPLGAEGIRWYLGFDNPFIHSSVMFRRAPIQSVFGAYPQSLHSEDYALWSRVAAKSPTANLGEPLVFYREHAGSVTGGMSATDSARFIQITDSIRAANLQHWLDAVGSEGPLTEAAAAVARIFANRRRLFSRESAEESLGAMTELLGLRPDLWPVSADLKRTVAVQFCELAYRLLPISGGMALRLYARALYLSPGLFGKLPWVRVCALLLLGDRARRIYLWIQGFNLKPRMETKE